MRVVLAAIICGVTPALAAAQSAPAPLPANDFIIATGWAGSNHDIHDYRQWRGSLLVAVSGGHYWTDHLKTEVDASWNSDREDDVYENIWQPGGYTYALWDYRAHDVRVGLTQLYQFGRNEWVHPYVGVGADVVRRQMALDRAPQSRTTFVQNRNVTVNIPAAAERKATVFAQAVLKGGMKMYVTEKAFFNTEIKFGIRRDVDHFVWKLGLGIDF